MVREHLLVFFSSGLSRQMKEATVLAPTPLVNFLCIFLLSKRGWKRESGRRRKWPSTTPRKTAMSSSTVSWDCSSIYLLLGEIDIDFIFSTNLERVYDVTDYMNKHPGTCTRPCLIFYSIFYEF
jgi:hypothetical protein